MLSSFRNLSKSKVGTVVLVLFLAAIVASFAIADISNLRSSAFGLGSSTLAEAGDEQVTERDLSDLYSRLVSRLREEDPNASGSSLAGQFDQIMDELITQRLLAAFATDNQLLLSKRLVDAEIARLPGTTGLNGEFSEDAYARFLNQQRLTDALVRRELSAELIQRLLLAPVAINPRMPTGIARQYASVQLEQRNGEVAVVVIDAFKPGLDPSAGDIQSFYDQNRARYMVPEQRVLRFARIAADSVTVPQPTDSEIAAAYKANAARYAGRQTRAIRQVVVADEARARSVAAKARAGATLDAAAAGIAEAIDLGQQARADFARVGGEQAAAAAFAAAPNAIVGPVRSDIGWLVLKVGPVQGEAGKSLAEARDELSAALIAEKRKEALADVIDKVEDAIADDASFPEAAAAGGLTVTETPPLLANGTSRAAPDFKLSPDLAAALRAGFELTPDDEPLVEELADDAGYVLVGVGSIQAAAPAPLATVRERVRTDWIQKKASDLARAAAAGIAAKVARGVPMDKAVAEAGRGAAGPRKVSARRIQLSQQTPAPAPIQTLFTLGEGKSRMIGDPEGRGFYVVRNTKIIPGDAGAQPGLIVRLQREYQNSLSGEYARQFVAAVRKDVGVVRNDEAIAAVKARLTTGN